MALTPLDMEDLCELEVRRVGGEETVSIWIGGRQVNL